MRLRVLVILCFLALSAMAQNVHILPTPQQIETADGQFVWDENVVLTYDAADAEISQIVAMWRSDLDQISGKMVQFSRGAIRGIVGKDDVLVPNKLTLSGFYLLGGGEDMDVLCECA